MASCGMRGRSRTSLNRSTSGAVSCGARRAEVARPRRDPLDTHVFVQFGERLAAIGV
jgi:hypothetical protein